MIETPMSHVGIITPPVAGHVHPFGALGRTLIKRGHRVTIFHLLDLEAKTRAEGLNFCALGQSDYPLGSLPGFLARISQLKGLAALRFTLRVIEGTTEMICRDGPEAIRKAGVDLLLVDQTEPAGATVAEHLKIPFVTICNALALNQDATVPPPITPWGFTRSPWGKLRNWAGYKTWNTMMNGIKKTLTRYRREWHLPLHPNPVFNFSTLAQLSQQPPAFDFPRHKLPNCFHYLGPFRDAGSQEIPFPWHQLDGRPLVYASLGTLQNRTPALFRCIAEACDGLQVQLVISHGGGLPEEIASTLPGHPLIVSYAPQQAVLSKARLTVSHAGLNTVLDSLSQGVPVVAIPLTYEQPAIAARLRWTGAGDVIPLADLSVRGLRQTVQNVLKTESFYTAARGIADSIHQAGGVERAADIVEEVLRSPLRLFPSPS
jgi:zeaxanthin glucosyltransferase